MTTEERSKLYTAVFTQLLNWALAALGLRYILECAGHPVTYFAAVLLIVSAWVVVHHLMSAVLSAVLTAKRK